VLACAVVTHVCQVRALFSLLRPPGFTLFPYTTLFRSILALGRVLREKRSEASSSTRRPAFARAPVRIFRAGELEKGRNDVDHVPGASPELVSRADSSRPVRDEGRRDSALVDPRLMFSKRCVRDGRPARSETEMASG